MNVTDSIMDSIAEILKDDGFTIGAANGPFNHISVFVDIGFGNYQLSSITLSSNCVFTCNGYKNSNTTHRTLDSQCRVDLADPKMFDKILEFNRAALNKYVDEIARSEYMKTCIK